MKHFIFYISVGILALALIVFVFSNFQKRPVGKSQLVQSEWVEKTDERSPVSIKVKPLEVGKNATSWKFFIMIDSHSVELNEDLLQTIILSDDMGNNTQPVTWDGTPPGGHHREGNLIFEPIVPSPQWIELKMQNIGGIPERSFRWEFNKALN